MSVIVKGMEMPKNCSDCPLNYDQMMCIVTGTRWWSDTMVLMGFDSDKERLHDCPLIELPPHGRLGDLDKLNIHDISPVDGFCVMGVTEEDIELADTVIEAEGETVNLPPAEPKRGKWIKISPANIYECSECGKSVMTNDICAYDFVMGAER